MRQTPFDVELIALGHMRTVGTNSKKKIKGGPRWLTPQNVVLEPPLSRFFFQKHSIRKTMKSWEKSQALVILTLMLNELHSTNLRLGGWASEAPPPAIASVTARNHLEWH